MVRRTVGGAGGFEERRRGERFKLALAVQLSDGNGGGAISAHREFSLRPRAHIRSESTIRLFLNFEYGAAPCEARVVRVEPRNGQFGIAVELKSYVFC